MRGDDLTEDVPKSSEMDGDDNDRVVDAVKQYMNMLDAGAAPTLEKYLAEHREIADALLPALQGLAMVHRAGPAKSTSLVAPDSDFTAKPIGDFQIIREIGRGGMGVVYEAIQLSLGRHVALKVLPFASGLDEVRLQRFRNEAHAAAALHHTNIVPVYAVGSDRGVHYFAMQMIDGQTLADLIEQLREERAQEPTQSIGDRRSTTAIKSATTLATVNNHSDRKRFYKSMVRMVVQAAIAIDHAHAYGVVHRDVKPANLLLDSAGKIWVADFGLAQVQASDSPLTRTGDPMGTLRYMSPEQAAGDRTALDHRTDVYSLGITLYELLTLTPAISGDGYREMLNQVVEHEPASPKSVDPNLPIELDTIIRKSIAKLPSERYASAGAFADDLQSWLDDKPIKARPPSTWERLAKWRRRNSGLVASAGGLLLLATVALSATTFMVWREQRATRGALDRETEQRQEAELNFQQARSAVDAFSNLSESELAYRPELQDLRRSFLETSLEFYRDFLDQRSDDPVLEKDLAAASDRVEQLVDELRLLDSVSPLLQLTDPSIQRELAIDSAKAASIDAGISEFQSQRRSMANQHVGGLTSKNEELSGLLRSFDAFISELLTEAQHTRLRQIARQRRLPFTFKTSEVVAELQLTRQQRTEINRIIEETRPMRGPGTGPGPGPGPGPGQGPGQKPGQKPGQRPGQGQDPHQGPPPIGFAGGDGPPPDFEFGGPSMRGREMFRSAATANTVQHILAILTPEQLTKWESLVGDPFDR